MKSVLFILGLFMLPDNVVEFRRVDPDCGTTHCKITLEEAQGIAQLQQTSIATIRQLKAELDEVKRRPQCRGGDA